MSAPEVVDAVAKAMCIVETRSKAASLEEVQAGIQRWTRHRYEAERLIEELTDGGVHVALPTPPADDVREALIDAMIDVEVSGGMVEFGKDDRAEAAYLADAILAAPGIEVRPRGTVTDGVSDELLLDSRTIHHARYGGLGGDVASLTITSEAWRRLGKPRAIQVSVSASPKADS